MKSSPRASFIKNANLKKLAGYAWDAMTLASTHDPEHSKYIRILEDRVSILERQIEQIAAGERPKLYRTVRKGNTTINIQRVRNIPGIKNYK